MKNLLLLSTHAGAGRTMLAANLAALLAGLSNAPVTILEHCAPSESEIALHRGEAPQDLNAVHKTQAGVSHACVENLGDLLAGLELLQSRPGWTLVDGASLEQGDWQAWARACGRLLLVERGDLAGCRRMLRLLTSCKNSHWPWASLQPVWMGEQSAQPLPALPDKPALSIPWYAKATERLAAASLPAIDDPKSGFAVALHRLLPALQALLPLARDAAVTGLPTVAVVTDEEQALVERLRQSLRAQLNLAAAEGQTQGSQDFKAQWEPRVRSAAGTLLAKEHAPWLDPAKRAQLADRMVQETLGLGPLEELLADPEVSEIMVNHPAQVYVERAGQLSLSPLRFEDDRQLRSIIERMVAPLGRRIDESSPRVDARLADGSRVNAIIPPLAVKGPCLTIRKFPAKRLDMDELVGRGALSPVAAQFLRQAVESRQNILVSGGTGSGKTTLLNALSSYIPAGERIVTIEDSAELKLQQPHVVTLESRPPNLEGHGEVSIRDLLVNSLRMRPDRIVVGECRGGEALDMLQAMNTGHEGSLSTLHANNARDALQRLETLCLMSGVELPLMVVRRQIASAIDLIIQIGRLRDGSRRVLSITELTGMEGDVLSTQDIFAFEQTGIVDGKVMGNLRATGIPARLYQTLKAAGERADFSVFERT
jgi:pilus assembly protein CpaF